MKEHAQNVIIGLTVIGALCLLGAMILTFTALPAVLQRGYEIKMRFSTTADAHESDPVHLAGIRIGRITDISFTDGDPRKGVTLTARIDGDTKIPGNINAYIFSKGIAGGAYVELKADGKERIDPVTGQAMHFLPTDGTVVIDGMLKTGIIPENLSKLADKLDKLIGDDEPVEQREPTTQGAAIRPAAQPGLKGTIAKLNRTLDALNKVISKENRTNLATSLKNLAKASAEARDTLAAVRKFADKAGANVDNLTRKLLENAEKLSALMDSINRTVTKIESGEGSAGKLINDPALYNSLLEASQQLSQSLKEFRQLIKQWQKKGLSLKLK